MNLYQTVDGSRVIEPESELLTFLNEKLLSYPFPVVWVNDVPNSEVAFHLYSSAPEFALIGVSEYQYYNNGKRRRRRFEEMWFSLIFELHNLDCYKDREALYKLAYDLEIGREEFTRKMCMLEHSAMEKSLDYVEQKWIPWAMRVGSFSLPSYQVWEAFSVDYEKWIGGHGGKDGPLWLNNERLYDMSLSLGSIYEERDEVNSALSELYSKDMKSEEHLKEIKRILNSKNKVDIMFNSFYSGYHD